MRSIFVFAVIGLLLVSSIDCAKKGVKETGKGKKGVKEAKVEKVKVEKVKAEKAPKEEKVKVEKPVEVEEPKVEEVVPEVKHVVAADPVVQCPHAAASVVDALAHEEEVSAAQSKLVKPKNLKVLTQYEQCKMECKKQRDAVTAQQYVDQLKAELVAAEAAIAEQAAAEAAAAAAAAAAEAHISAQDVAKEAQAAAKEAAATA